MPPIFSGNEVFGAAPNPPEGPSGGNLQVSAPARADPPGWVVLVLVVVPHELVLKLDDLHLVIVQIAHDVGLKLVGEEGEFLQQVDFVHRGFLSMGEPRRVA